MATKASKTSKNAKNAKVDWSLAPRGAVSATVQSAVGLAAVGVVGEVAGISPVLAAAGAVTGAMGHVVVGAHHNHTPGAIMYRLGCWLGAGGWLTWAWTDGPIWEHPNGLAALAVGAVGAGVMSPLGRATKRTTTGAPGTAVVVRPGGSVAIEWEARFKRVCRVGVQVTDLRSWDNKAGYDVVCQLPQGPATRRQIAGYTDALATDARLPEGCGVEIKPGSHRGEFVLAVSTINRLGSASDPSPVKLPYPADYTPRSVLNPIELGEHRDASVSGVMIREDSVLIVARKGGGKTSLLDALTLGIGRCRDALNWHIDLNGGGMSQLWLHPWLEGDLDRPPVDWCAPNPQEALLMTTIALAIAKDRKSSYRTFKAQSNSKLLPVSDRLPEIVISVDEGAEALAPANRDPITRQVRDNLEEIQRIGRNEAVNVVITALRPTQDMISPNILKQSAIKIGMYGIDEPDLGHLYGWRRDISTDDLPTQGCAFVGVGPAAPRPMKAWFLQPDQIRDAALVIARIRPDLDAAGQDVANGQYEIDLGDRDPVLMSGIYAGRHDRMRAAFTGRTVNLPAVPTPAKPAPAAGPAPLRVLKGGAAAWPDPIPTRQHKQAAPPVSASAWPDPLPGRATTSTATATVALPEPIARAIAAFDAAGDDRMHSEVLADALGVSDPWALAELLRPFGVQARPKFKRGGVERRGYWLEDLRAAADRAAFTPADEA